MGVALVVWEGHGDYLTGSGDYLTCLGLASVAEGGHSVGFLTICLPVFLDVYHMDMHMKHECHRQIDGDPRDLEHEQD